MIQLTRIATRLRSAALGLAFCLAIQAPMATALENCEVTQKDDGTLQVSAKKVAGTLRYGTSEQIIEGRFYNDEDCRNGAKASGCVLAAKKTPERSMHPPFCRLYLEDNEDSCSPKVKHCTPGLRPTCPPDMERLGAGCIERSLSLDLFPDAVNECRLRGRTLCTESQLMTCDSGNVSNSRPRSCGWATDGGAWLWSMNSNAVDGENLYANVQIYKSDNVVRDNNVADGSYHNYFCCAPLGTP